MARINADRSLPSIRSLLKKAPAIERVAPSSPIALLRTASDAHPKRFEIASRTASGDDRHWASGKYQKAGIAAPVSNPWRRSSVSALVPKLKGRSAVRSVGIAL